MRIPLTSISAGGLTLMTLSTLSLAQEAPPAAVYDPHQFPAIRGELDRLTLTPRGEIDGFILKDGTEVKTAPDLSTQIAFAIKPGDRVTVHGLKAAALPLVSAVSVTDEATHRTVTDSGISAATPMIPPSPPARPPRGAPPPPAATSETSGRVRMALHGPQGEVNGVLLENGTILRFPPDQGAQITTLIQPRQSVVAEGIAITSALGTVVDVQQIGPSRNQLTAVGPPARPIDDRGPGSPRRRPPPPPADPATGPGAPPPPAPPAA
jgi:hypothetical protein